MSIKWSPHLPEMSESNAFDVLPCSNGEYALEQATPEQLAVMAIQETEGDKLRRRLGMSRRDFVRSAAAMSLGVWALQQVNGGKYGGSVAEAKTTQACDVEYKGAQLANLPGEFIFDVQSHHVDTDDQTWRVRNPEFHAFFAAVWSQAGPLGGFPEVDPQGGTVSGWGNGEELDPIENLSRHHYFKELYLDSSTTMTVLSAVPAAPDDQPLGVDKAALTLDTVNRLAQHSPRCVMHAFVMPNRGSAGSAAEGAGRDPLYMQEEFDLMERNLLLYGAERIRGWKVYPAWGDIKYASGWFLDDRVGEQFCDQVLKLSAKYGNPPVIAMHKGFALPGFDQRAASPREVGVAARNFPGVKFVVYHSGFDNEAQRPYAGDDKVNSGDRTVDSLVKSLRENRWDASQFKPSWSDFGNVPNVWAEIGSTWRTVLGRNKDEQAHLLGKLITHVGPRRVVWGTDSLWFGSPQSEIVGLRAFEFTQAGKELYKLPHGLEGDRWDPTRNSQDASSYLSPHPHIPDWPTDGRAHPERSIRNGIFGRNAAEAYEVDADAKFKLISCDDVQRIRDSYQADAGTPRARAPLASNKVNGARSNYELLADMNSKPWAP